MTLKIELTNWQQFFTCLSFYWSESVSVGVLKTSLVFVLIFVTAIHSLWIISNIFIFLFQFDEGRNDYDGEYDFEKIQKFIKANQLPLVTEFSDEVSTILLIVLISYQFRKIHGEYEGVMQTFHLSTKSL